MCLFDLLSHSLHCDPRLLSCPVDVFCLFLVTSLLACVRVCVWSFSSSFSKRTLEGGGSGESNLEDVFTVSVCYTVVFGYGCVSSSTLNPHPFTYPNSANTLPIGFEMFRLLDLLFLFCCLVVFERVLSCVEVMIWHIAVSSLVSSERQAPGIA